MIQNNAKLRIVCGAVTLFFTIGLCWVFEVFLVVPRGHFLARCCRAWRLMQIVPYLLAGLVSDPVQQVNLTVFWLLFAMQWFLIGTLVVSHLVVFLGHVADLIKEQNAERPALPSVLGVES